MTVHQLKESAFRLFVNPDINRRKINNLTKLQNNIEVRSKILNQYIENSETELEQLSDLKIKAEVERHNTENKYNQLKGDKLK